MRVSIVRTSPHYPPPPFHPSEPYPEYPFPEKAISLFPNRIYAAVRNALYLLGLDARNYGTSSWNPLGGFLQEGSRIIIKPNWVCHNNLLSAAPSYFEALVTQSAVMRPIVDYLLIASRGPTKITFVDLPIQSADFLSLRQKVGIDSMINFALANSDKPVQIDVLDLRKFRLITEPSGAVLGKAELSGDSQGYVKVDLGSSSSLTSIEKDCIRFRVSDYDQCKTVSMHSRGIHQYIIPRTILQSDLFINVPKLKTHRKAGVTLCLKNLVGVIGDKSCLPHFRSGAPEQGGDEYPIDSSINSLHSRYSFRLRRAGKIVWTLVRPFGRALIRLNQQLHRDKTGIRITNGDWHANDTLWRMVHDVNKIIRYADATGTLRDKPQREYLAFVDGVIGGEGEGPLMPSPVPCGILIAGFDPVAIDVVCTRLMGLAWEKIPLYSGYNPSFPYPFSDFDGELDRIQLLSSDPTLQQPVTILPPLHPFKVSNGWKGHIEIETIASQRNVI